MWMVTAAGDLGRAGAGLSDLGKGKLAALRTGKRLQLHAQAALAATGPCRPLRCVALLSPSECGSTVEALNSLAAHLDSAPGGP